MTNEMKELRLMYCLFCRLNTDVNVLQVLIYVGETKRSLNKRMLGHTYR
jgi:hypothetical protein